MQPCGIFVTVCCLFIYLLLNAAQRESLSPNGPKISVTGLGDKFSSLGDICCSVKRCSEPIL